MSGYVADNYVQAGYVRDITPPGVMAFPVPAPGEFVSASPQPGRITVEASPPTTNLPRGPFGMVPALVLANHAGTRIFSEVAIDPIYAVPPAVGRYVTLLSVDALNLTQGGSGSTLVTRITSLELPSFTCVFDNTSGQWSQLVASEVMLCMTISLYMDLGGGTYKFSGRGEIQEIVVTRKTATVRVGA